jgi:predicted transcriptional regulator
METQTQTQAKLQVELSPAVRLRLGRIARVYDLTPSEVARAAIVCLYEILREDEAGLAVLDRLLPLTKA